MHRQSNGFHTATNRCTHINLFNNDVICGKALKSVSAVLSEFFQIANIAPTLTTYWHKRGEQLRNE